jgi:hypothetical protein
MSKKAVNPPIDYSLLESLATVGCTITECAVILGLTSYKAIQRDPRARDIYKKCQEKLKRTLRHAQIQTALGVPTEYVRDDDGKIQTDKYGKPYIQRYGAAPNPAMQIFLGKNMLGQTDKQEITGAGGGPLLTEKRTVYQFPPAPGQKPDPAHDTVQLEATPPQAAGNN